MLLAALTLVGGGGGGFLGMTLGQDPSASVTRSAEIGEGAQKNAGGKHQDPAESHDTQAKAGQPGAKTIQFLQVKELPPVVTNLAIPETSWIRLQASIAYDAKSVSNPELLVTELTSDLVAFLRTISLTSIEGAEGLRRLNEDLSERATIRSEGRVREFIIQSLVVQ